MAAEILDKAVVIKNYEASDPDPLIITAGEALQVGKNDTTWPAFIRCTNNAGKQGWVPEAFIDRHGDAGTASVDYSAAELTVASGEVVILKQEAGGWYWVTNLAGNSGWVPAEYVQT